MAVVKVMEGEAAEGMAVDVGEEGQAGEERGAMGAGLVAVAGAGVETQAEAGAAMAAVGERVHQIEGGEQVSALMPSSSACFECP